MDRGATSSLMVNVTVLASLEDPGRGEFVIKVQAVIHYKVRH